MLAWLKQIFPIIVGLLWFGGSLTLFIWTRVASRTYLRRFGSVDGVPLDMYLYIPGELPNVHHAGRAAMWEQQDNPELESLRHTVWKRFRYTILWVVGFPLLTFGILFVLGITGHLQ